MNYINLDALCEKLKCEYFKDESMAKHSSFKIGGNADRYILASNLSMLQDIVKLLKNENIPYYILGNGSNILVKDGGIRAVVISLDGDFKEIKMTAENQITVGAGALLSSLCIFAKNNNLGGLEFAYGIPGSVGGAAYMNAGAYGGEMKDVLVSCHHIDENGMTGCFSKEELDLSYRHSAYSFKNYIITSLVINLVQDEKENISSKMEDFMQRRKDKQPLNFPSAGSTFKRPQGYYASALIEECGLKGMSVGGAQVSRKHSGFVINKGNASCQDVLDLIENVKAQVQAQKGVELECEVEILGE